MSESRFQLVEEVSGEFTVDKFDWNTSSWDKQGYFKSLKGASVFMPYTFVSREDAMSYVNRYRKAERGDNVEEV